MSPQPTDQRMQNFGTANQQGGRQRTFFTLAFLTRAGITGAAVAALGLVLEVATPVKPFSMLGTGYGNLMGAEYAAREEREAHYINRTTEASLKPQLDNELQKLKTTTMLNTNSAAQTGEATASIAADLACVAGRVWTQLGTQQFCGVGGAVRDRMQGEVVDVYNHSRGLPATGSVAPPAGYDIFAPTPKVKDVYRDQVRQYEDMLSGEAVARARQDLPPGDAGTLVYLGKLKALAGE